MILLYHIVSEALAKSGEIFADRLKRCEVKEPNHWCRSQLRACRKRPRASEQHDELAPPHSITSSANNKNDSGTVRSSALAVFKFTTKLNFVGS